MACGITLAASSPNMGIWIRYGPLIEHNLNQDRSLSIALSKNVCCDWPRTANRDSCSRPIWQTGNFSAERRLHMVATFYLSIASQKLLRLLAKSSEFEIPVWPVQFPQGLIRRSK